MFGGVKLDIRSIDVNVDRSQFMLNPTNCAAQATSGTINGGGADPANPAAFSSYAVSDSVRGNRMRQPRLQAEAAHAAVRADQAGEEPAHPGDPGSARRRRQPQPHRADAAALDVPRPEPHQDGLHEAAAGLADLPDGGGLRPRGSDDAAAQRHVEGPGLPGVLQPQAAGPGRRPARSGQHPAARRDQLQARRAEDRVQRGCRTSR